MFPKKRLKIKCDIEEAGFASPDGKKNQGKIRGKGQEKDGNALKKNQTPTPRHDQNTKRKHPDGRKAHRSRERPPFKRGSSGGGSKQEEREGVGTAAKTPRDVRAMTG